MAIDEIKQVVIVRADLDMGKGKIGAQIGHAVILSYLEAERKDERITKEWLSSGQKKIVLKVTDEEALIKLYKAFQFKRIPCAIVNDAGLTQLPPGTTTALGVGPWKSGELDFITGKLKLL
jgi:PTH2 family peptidyl-tRNA hydrolase